MSRSTRRLSYANVTATAALVLALTGGAYAAATLPKNSVGPKQIKDDAVRSAEVKNKSLKRSDFKAGVLPAAPSVVTRFQAFDATMTATATCLAGERVVGGGYDAAGNGADVVVYRSRPEPTGAGTTPTGWNVGIFTGGTFSGGAFVLCGKP